MTNKFTPKSKDALNCAKLCAEKMGHTYIGSEHLLLGIICTDCVGAKILDEKKILYSDVYDSVVKISGVGTKNTFVNCAMTPKCRRIIENSSVCATKFSGKFIGTEHILYSICNEPDAVASRILVSLGINLQNLKSDISAFLDSGNEKSQNDKGFTTATTALSQYGVNLNSLCREGKSDPVIGREKDEQRLIQILSRKTKNNPCLIGEPGVGKTAVVEGLAKRICDNDVPDDLLGKTIISLDISSMIAGAKYRGEFEERMRNVLNELKNNPSIILFIDEFHTIIGAGAAEGAVDAANIIKPALARGQIRIIGATTIDEFRKHIEKDAALERRFQPVIIEEPTEEQTIEILNGLRPKFEEHHKVKISDEAIKSAVSLSVRYINDRFLPDKAIDLIDEACSKIRIAHFSKTPVIKDTEEKIKNLSEEKENAILNEEFELASKIRDEEVSLKLELNKLKNKWEDDRLTSSETVTSDDIYDIVTLWTHIPVKKLANEEKEKLKGLENSLKEKVIGQDTAIETVAKAIKRGRLGLKNPNRPIGSFLFLGPTGVGKTELAKSIAEEIFASKDSMIRLDMSEYSEKHSVSKIIGSPPGYVGYDEGGALTDAVRLKPYSVILFDEIEKAHPEIYNVLLQILEDGILTDSQSRKVNFKNTIIILTSNIGAKNITEPKNLGFSTGDTFRENEMIKSSINDALRSEFSPEFLNRLDEIIIFEKLSFENIQKISSIMLKDVSKLAKGIGITLTFDDKVTDFLAKTGYNNKFGARPLRRAIMTNIENALSEEILSENIFAGDNILCTYENEKIVFQKQ